MANSEDYLDGLLNSVQNVRKDVSLAEEQAEENRKLREEQRNRIRPEDDFMEASGLNHYTPEKSTHSNLRKVFSEDDFLRRFEEELEDDSQDADAFLRDFEEELSRDELAFEQELSQDEDADEDIQTQEQEAGAASFLDNIEQIVNQAKEQIEQGEPPLETELTQDHVLDSTESQEDEIDDLPDISMDDGADDLLPLEEFSPDELDAQFADTDDNPEEPMQTTGSEEEMDVPVMTDEEDDEVDLMDLLSGDADLDDISSLLEADENHIELEESQQEYETQVAAEQSQEASDEERSGSDDAWGAESGKFNLGALIDKIKSIFSRNKKGDGEAEKVLDISSGEGDNLSQENLEILKDLADADKKAAEKKKPKKEKKPKEPKEKKPKKERVKKEKPPKPPKEPDNSPKIPGKVIFVFLLLGVTFVILVTLGQQMMGYKLSLSDARSAYNKGDYLAAYDELMGLELKEEDSDLFRKARLLGDLQKRQEEYQTFMQTEMYEFALDSLVTGVVRYEENKDEASELGIETEYQTMGEELVRLLQDQFGVSMDDAVDLYKCNREDYSIRLDAIIEELHFN